MIESMSGAVPYSRSTLPRSILIMFVAVIAFALLVRATMPPRDDPVDEPFTYSFHVDGVLEESEDFSHSASEYWWLDSGGRLVIENGVGSTIQGALPMNDRWRRLYAESNPRDTADGRYPQNLFRLVTQREWENVSVSARFKIIKDTDIESPNRNESNGLLLMSRYQDGDNLYYAGLRVDGHAIIKKKIDGRYYTLAERPIYEDPDERVNLIPHDGWIALKSDTVTRGSIVEITLYRRDHADIWQPILNATDADSPILGQGHTGIRTDFMDVEFDDFRAEAI